MTAKSVSHVFYFLFAISLIAIANQVNFNSNHQILPITSGIASFAKLRTYLFSSLAVTQIVASLFYSVSLLLLAFGFSKLSKGRENKDYFLNLGQYSGVMIFLGALWQMVISPSIENIYVYKGGIALNISPEALMTIGAGISLFLIVAFAKSQKKQLEEII